MPELSLAGVRRLMRKAGVSRVGQDAVEALREYIEDVAVQVAKIALELAEHAGRKTVQKEDVLRAVRLLSEAKKQ